MLDLAFIAKNSEQVKENCQRRGHDVDVDRIVELDRQRRDVQHRLDEARRDGNLLAKQWKNATDPAAHRQRAAELKHLQGQLEGELATIGEELDALMARLPNMLDPRVPLGGDEANVVIRKVGDTPQFDFEPRSHEVIGELTNLIDIPGGVNVAGARFYCLKNEAVALRYALIKLFVEHAREQGFELVCPPFMARRESLFASGYLPFQDKDNFALEGTDLSLIGTSEQSLLGMHIGAMLSELPLLYLGDSMCFRTEAGSYGRDTAGILRVHQFYKLEQFVYCHPDESEKYHQLCLDNEEWLMQQIEVPYQVVLTSSKDLGAPGRIKYDTEAWFPSQQRYREATSNTNLGDFQTRRGRIRFKIAGEKGFPHTISATGFCDRLIISILENYQQADGSVRVPRALVPHLGTEVIPVRRKR